MLARLSPELSATVQRLANPVIVRAVPFFRTAGDGRVLHRRVRAEAAAVAAVYTPGQLIISTSGARCTA